MSRLATALATLGGIGRIPFAPGTWGSLLAILLVPALLDWLGTIGFALATLLATLIGIWSASLHEGTSGKHDGSEVVIDELAGQWATVLPLLFIDAVRPALLDYLLAFALFRLFDIWKPWPIGRLDAVVPGGFGTMLDDLVAAIPAGALLVVLHFVVFLR